MTKFEAICEEVKKAIRLTHEEGVTMEEAEKLAAKFLGASILVGEELKAVDLDRRMKKAGLKTIKASAYLNAASQGDKKPSDKLIEAVIDTDKDVSAAQDLFDVAEVNYNELINYLSVFHEAHIYYRSIAKGRFDA